MKAGDILAEKKGRKTKCLICGESNYKEDAEQVGTRYYCKGVCLEEVLEKKDEKNQDKEDWDELFNYIKELYGHKPTGMMFKQLGDYRKDPYNYTNKGMYLTLKYFYETQGNSVIENSGLGIIAYVYEDAKKNYLEQLEVSDYNKEYKSFEQIEKVKINRRKNKCKEKLMGSMINFDDLDKELEEEDGE
jgi:hypothetical protein